MSNPSTGFGLRPVRTLSGTPWNAQLIKAYIPVGDVNAMYVGDPVVFAGAADTAGTSPSVQLATCGAGYPILGVITSFEPDPNNLTLTYRPASTARYCYITWDPMTVYQIRSAGTPVAADIGSNTYLVIGSGSTATGLSGYTAYGTVSANSTYQLQILDVSYRPDNTLGQYVELEVLISLHAFNAIYDAHSGATAWYGGKGV